MKKDNLQGLVFGRLTVVEPAASNSYGHTRWLCKCDCGSDKVCYSADLKLGKMKSCGCLRSDLARIQRTLPAGEAAARSLMAGYRKSARERGLAFELTEDEFRALVDKPCHYCGVGPQLKAMGVNRMAKKNVNGNFSYTGIDRVDSSLGYIKTNCLPCCKTCNFAKNDMSYQYFMDYLDRLVAFRFAKNNKSA